MSPVANRLPGVDMTLLREDFMVGSVAQSVFVLSCQCRRLPPTVNLVL